MAQWPPPQSASAGGTLPFKIVDFSHSPVTLPLEDAVLSVNTQAGPVQVVLPDPLPAGQYYRIKDSGNASNNGVTIVGSIDGAATAFLTESYAAVSCCSTGTDWLIF